MGENSKIEWCDHTFNPWIGCSKVSAGCTNCYAETRNRRFKDVVWGSGPESTRRRTSEAYWKQPLKWNRKAKETGERPRVFCGSLCDVFEDWPGLEDWRLDLMEMIQITPNIDWLLLTKRPENVNMMIERESGYSDHHHWFHSAPNVWIGTSVENQETANERIPFLLRTPAAVRFLSVEPMLGPVVLAQVPMLEIARGLHWVIVGGESGSKARPMRPAWLRSLRDQCVNAGIAFHFKQWGEYVPYDNRHELMKPVSKKKAGRVLDGRTWEEYPAQQEKSEWVGG